MSLNKQKNKKAVKPKPTGQGDNPKAESEAYKLPPAVILEIRKVASIYGSRGRAVQVEAEKLKRLT